PDRRVGQDRDHVWLDLQKSALDVDDLFFCLSGHLDWIDLGLDLSDERRMPRISTKLAHDPGKHDEFRVAGVDRLLGADDIDVNGVRHWVTRERKSLQRLRFFDGLFDAAYHVERLLRQVIVFAIDDGLETADRVLERDEFSR